MLLKSWFGMALTSNSSTSSRPKPRKVLGWSSEGMLLRWGYGWCIGVEFDGVIATCILIFVGINKIKKEVVFLIEKIFFMGTMN